MGEEDLSSSSQVSQSCMESSEKNSCEADMVLALGSIMQSASSGCTLAELYSVTSSTLMEYYQADSVFFFDFDQDMKVAKCSYEMHRPEFAPICGTEPMYLDNYPSLLTVFMQTAVKLVKRMDYIYYPDILSKLPKNSKEYVRLKQIGMESVIGAGCSKEGNGFIVVVNPGRYTEESQFLPMLTYILDSEMKKQESYLEDGIFSFDKENLADNEVYVCLLNGFEMRTARGLITEDIIKSNQGVTALTLLLFQIGREINGEHLCAQIWDNYDSMQDCLRSLKQIFYRMMKKIRKYFPAGKFVLIRRDSFSIGRTYKITTDLDVFSYKIRDAEAIADPGQRLASYLKLLNEFSGTVLPNQDHAPLEPVIELYTEKRKNVQDRVLALMCELEEYGRMKEFINSILIDRGMDSALIYWNVKTYIGLKHYNTAREQIQIHRNVLTAAQVHELEEELSKL